VFHAVTHPDDDEPYTVLKEDLLQQHTLTKYQRIERLLAVGLLGSCRPSQLLAEMMELCPDNEVASCFFVFFFLQRLPAWLCIRGLQFYTFFGISTGITRRMIDIGKKLTFYFL
jgi:hypothetical protein